MSPIKSELLEKEGRESHTADLLSTSLLFFFLNKTL